MPTVNLATLRTSIATLGDVVNSPVFTAAFLNEWINRALEEFHEFVVDAWEGYYDKTDETTATAQGTQEYNLPADFFRLRLLERKLGQYEYFPLRRLTLIETSRFRDTGTPRGYMLYGASGGGLPGRLRLFPIPDGVYTIRLTYIPIAKQLVADGDSYDFLPGGDEFVICKVLRRVAEREERPIAEWVDGADRAANRIRAMVPRRDSAEPEYLVPRSNGYWSEDD
jgi:hypothetical protein